MPASLCFAPFSSSWGSACVCTRFRVLNGFDTFGAAGKCMPSAEELYEEKRERVFSLLRVVMEVLPHVRVTITKHAKATAPQ